MKRIFVKAKTGAKKQQVVLMDSPAVLFNTKEKYDANFKIFVKEPPVKGKANKAIIKALAEYLNIAPSKISIVSGHTSRRKILQVDNLIKS